MSLHIMITGSDTAPLQEGEVYEAKRAMLWNKEYGLFEGYFIVQDVYAVKMTKAVVVNETQEEKSDEV